MSEATDVTTAPLQVSWKTLVAGDEQLQQPQSKSTQEIVHSQLKHKLFTYMDWVAYWQGLYGFSSPSTKVLHDTGSGSVGRAVIFDTQGPRFESGHCQTFIQNIYLLSTLLKRRK